MPTAVGKMRVGGRRGEKGADKGGPASAARRGRPAGMIRGADNSAATNLPAARAPVRRKAANCCSRFASRMDLLEGKTLRLETTVIQQRDRILMLERALLEWGAMEDQLAKAACKQNNKIGTLEVTVLQLILALDNLKRGFEEKCGDGKRAVAPEGGAPQTPPPAGGSPSGVAANVVVPPQQVSNLANLFAGVGVDEGVKDKRQAVVMSPPGEMGPPAPPNPQPTIEPGASDGSPSGRHVAGVEGAGESDGESFGRAGASVLPANRPATAAGGDAWSSELQQVGADVASPTVAPSEDRVVESERRTGVTGGREEGGGDDKTESGVAALTMMALQKSLVEEMGPKQQPAEGEARVRVGYKAAGKPPRPPTSPGAPTSTLRVIGLRAPTAAIERNVDNLGFPARSRRGVQCRTLGPKRSAAGPPASSRQEHPLKTEQSKGAEDVAPEEEEEEEEEGGLGKEMESRPHSPTKSAGAPEKLAARKRAGVVPPGTRKYKRTKTAGGGAPVIIGAEGGAFHPVVKPTPVHHSKQSRPLWCGPDSGLQIWWCATPGGHPVQGAMDPSGEAETINLTD